MPIHPEIIEIIDSDNDDEEQQAEPVSRASLFLLRALIIATLSIVHPKVLPLDHTSPNTHPADHVSRAT